MLTLTKRELAMLASIQPGYVLRLIEIRHKGSRWWRMTVELPQQGKVYEVRTALGKTKLWRNLDIAVDFIEEVCHLTQVAHIHFQSGQPNG